MLKLKVSMCVLCWNLVTVCIYAGVVAPCVVCVHVELCVVQRICDLLPKLCQLQRISIHY